MKTRICAIVLCALTLHAGISKAAVSFGGTAFVNAPGLVAGQVGVLLSSDDGLAFSVLDGNIQFGLSLTDSSTYSGSWGNFSVLGSNTADTVFGSTILSGGATFDLTGGINTDDAFAYLVFQNSTTTTLAGDAISIWTAENWLIPADGASLTWPANFTQMTSTSTPVATTSVNQPAASGGTFTARAPGGVHFINSTHVLTADPNAPPAYWVATVLPTMATSWSVTSDRHMKKAITAVDHRETLRKVSDLPVTAWQYKHQSGRRYIGPMAQDFHASFGLGRDDKHLSTLDADGVTLSALKGLIAELQDRKARSAAQDKRLAELEAELQALSEKLRGNLPPAE